ncbi:ABC transporter ATP-binding protein [Streptomyces sp. HF10]|uniref:ABC transporter ATP-binding protein n=1 Tax=Streptomyces sp. HF10 TaxID=2692233 RepID=UPI0013199BCB|nr:ATP-binding cassette domain-containing protein [Streptomyces sp. HF10]QHC31956.1 ATP-binding cassette domain-containing protein [Streptomyces sp. HF10]
MSAEVPLCISGLDYEIGGRKLLSALELTVRSGESVAVTGPSGSGKSTLLSLILGLVRAPAGRILVAGEDVAALPGGKLARWRQRHMGMVFQFGELLPELSPVENVALPALLAGENRGEAFSRGRELLAGLGVPVDGALTADLSGGERQRTAVARALMSEPSLLLADEPTGALDEQARDQVADVLFDAPRRRGCGLLVVTHDASVAERADRVLRLGQGRLVDATDRGQA